jgi:hypothetical protein
MEPLVIFVLQFLWFLFAWSLIVYFVVWPWSARLPPDARLSAWVAPEMFRVLGVGLLVPSSLSGHAQRVRVLYRGRRLAHGRSGRLGIHRVAAGLGSGAWLGVGMHRRRHARPIGCVSPCRRHRGNLAHGGSVVRPGIRGAASRHLPRFLFHPARPRSNVHGFLVARSGCACAACQGGVAHATSCR